MSLVFDFFQNISQMVLGSSRRRFRRKFQVLSFGNKNDFNHRNKKEKNLKSTDRSIISETFVTYTYSDGQSYSSTPMSLHLFANACRKINYKRFRLVIFSNT